MSFLAKFPPKLQHILIEGAKELAGFVWFGITGEHDAAMADVIARAAAENLAQTAYLEAQIRLGASALDQAIKTSQERSEGAVASDELLAEIVRLNRSARATTVIPEPLPPPPPLPPPLPRPPTRPPLPEFDESDATPVGGGPGSFDDDPDEEA